MPSLYFLAARSRRSAPAQERQPVPPPAVSAVDVKAAIDKAVAFLKSRQADDGSWPYNLEKPDHLQGAAALAVLALSEAGLPANDPAVEKGMQFITAQPFTQTYDTALVAMAIVSTGPGRYMQVLAKARDAVVSGQTANGQWGYVLPAVKSTSGDGSNTQFAVMGLHAASSVGLAIPQNVLWNVENYYTAHQNADGGWGYRPDGDSYGAMTAAGVAVSHLLGARLYVESDKCGQYSQDRQLAAGFNWLERHYSVTQHPGGEAKRIYYYLYALERVGVFTGQRYIAGHDWYLEGAKFLLDDRNPDGSWSSGRDNIPDTCFALLFLAKGNVPVLINKLNYGGEWNVDPHDAENLTQYISTHFGQRVGWQSVTIDEPVEKLLAAPILYITGHEFPVFTPDQLDKFRVFFENGGFILADACCDSEKFDNGFRLFVASLFPGVPSEPLPKTHPVYRSMFDLTMRLRSIEGVEAGCRTNILYTPRDISCVWEKNEVKNDEEAFQLGANVAAYVTGKERLVPRLEQYKSIPSTTTTTAAPGAFTFAQVIYSGGRWNPHPAAAPRLLDFLNKKAGLSVTTQPVSLLLTDKNLANYPFIYMTGPRRFALSDDEKTALREHLERGALLFADATTGQSDFDEAFRALMAEVFPDAPLTPIPADSPVYRVAFDASRVTYTPRVRELNPNLDTLTLYGVTVNGRIAVVYSPYDVGCALVQTPSYGSRGLVSEDAFKVAANVVLFALSF